MEKASPEEMQQIMQMWMDWIGGSVKAGWMLDGGDALTPGGAVVDPDLHVTDGPFAESKELVGGYSVIEAPDMATAVERAKGSPILKMKGYVEVREFAQAGV